MTMEASSLSSTELEESYKWQRLIKYRVYIEQFVTSLHHVQALHQRVHEPNLVPQSQTRVDGEEVAQAGFQFSVVHIIP